MAISWACQLSVAECAAAGRRVSVPRQRCTSCEAEMAFDGSYLRRVREAGVVHRVFVRRARCVSCGVGHALVPDFVLARRRDSANSVGAAILTHAGYQVPEGALRLYEGVSERTVRTWRQRFAERAGELTKCFGALSVAWGEVPSGYGEPPVKAAIEMIGATWRAASRRCRNPVAPAWHMANIMTGSQLLANRVDLPQATGLDRAGRSRAP